MERSSFPIGVELNSVQVFDSRGEFLKKFKPPEGDPETRGKLSHVTVSEEGRVYVADCEKRVIYVFDSSGEYLLHFKAGCLDDDHGLQRKIYGIVTNSRGNLTEKFRVAFTLNRKREIRVYVS